MPSPGPPDTTKIIFEKNGKGRQAHTRNWIFKLLANKAWRSSTIGALLLLSGVGSMGNAYLPRP